MRISYIHRNREACFIALLILSPLLLLAYHVVHIYTVREHWGIPDLTLQALLALLLRSLSATFLPYLLIALLSIQKRRTLTWCGYLFLLGTFVWYGFDESRLRLLGIVSLQGDLSRNTLDIMIYEAVTRLFGVEGVLILTILLLATTTDLFNKYKNTKGRFVLAVGQYLLISAWIALFVLFQGVSTSAIVTSIPAVILLAGLIATEQFKTHND
jgi:hypothetical protein